VAQDEYLELAGQQMAARMTSSPGDRDQGGHQRARGFPPRRANFIRRREPGTNMRWTEKVTFDMDPEMIDDPEGLDIGKTILSEDKRRVGGEPCDRGTSTRART
jgi:hypothetical protein